ncbi:MAG: HNH endonuclease [Croceibacterium sp.]
MKKIQKIRAVCFQHQQGRCHYCGFPMWQEDMPRFARDMGITPNQARMLQATAEHLVPRSEGGKDHATNVVAACHTCNTRRHKRKVPRTPAAHRAWILTRLAAGAWHCLPLSKA